MVKKPLHDGVLLNTLAMIDLYKRQLALAREMAKGIEYRIAMAEELVRANFTGDTEAFKTLAPAFAKNIGSSRRYYDDDGLTYASRTKEVVKKALLWKELYEQENPPVPVPALQDRALPDEAREAAAAQCRAGAALSDVESEGGHTD